MSFGGTVKLTGESEYRKAIQNITQDLGKMSKALKDQTADFTANENKLVGAKKREDELRQSLEKQQAEINKAKSSYASYSASLEGQKAKHQALNKEYKNAVLELEKIGKTSGTTSAEYKKQASEVDKLEQELADSTKEMNESKSAMSSLNKEINASQKVANSTAKELDGLEKETKDAGDQAEKSAKGGFTVFKGILADLGASAIKSAISGIGKLGGAVASAGKQALESYADYEQLVGGVETLFKDNAKDVIKYSKEAYKTAGMSANTYMETVTSFSASMISSLGGDTKKATEYSNQAIIDMSDNANKMGTDIQSIQNAYQGFAKQNYSMLDNLKLGYGGTQKEMFRLMQDAQKLDSTFDADFSLDSKGHLEADFADITKAIHIVQENMGITGTTSKEASATIQGSVSTMKSAWSNLLTGIADDNADLDSLINNFVDSLLTAGKNLLPRIQQIVKGGATMVSKLLSELVPELVKTLPPLLNDTLPVLLNAVQTVIKSVLELLPQIMPIISKLIPDIVNSLVSMLPLILDAGIKVIVSLIQGITEAIPQLVAMLPEVIQSIVNVLVENLPLIIDAGIELILALIDGIDETLPVLIDMMPEIVSKIVVALVKATPKLVKGAVKFANGFITGFNQMVVDLLKALPKVVAEVVKGLNEPLYNKAKELWSKVKDVFKNVGTWFKDTFSKAWTNIKNVFSKWGEFFGGLWDKIKDKFKDIGTSLGKAMSDTVKKGMNTVINSIESTINKGIKMINKAIKIINKIPKVNISKLELLDLPRLAKGGVVDNPTVAEVGENGAEAIVPLENNTKWIKRVAGELADTMSINTPVQLNAKKDYNVMVGAFKDALKQVKIELDDQVAGKFVEKTVTRVIYN